MAKQQLQPSAMQDQNLPKTGNQLSRLKVKTARMLITADAGSTPASATRVYKTPFLPYGGT